MDAITRTRNNSGTAIKTLMMTKQEIQAEVSHIFNSGANEISVQEMVVQLVKRAAKEVRHAAAEIAVSSISKDEAHQAIMNISVF